MTDKSKKLTAKKVKFVKCYLANGFNGTKGAIEAGYSEKTARSIATRLLANVDIKEAIQKEQEKTSKKLEITRESLLKDIQVAKDMALTEEQPQFQAYLKAIEMQAKILGLNEPDKIDMNTTLQVTTVPTFADFKKR